MQHNNANMQDNYVNMRLKLDGGTFCLHLSDNYVDLSDLYVDLSLIHLLENES